MTKNVNSDQCIKDAVTMLKSVFIENYEVYGHDPEMLGELWHKHRTSPKGREMKKKFGNIQVYSAPDSEPKSAIPKTPKKLSEEKILKAAEVINEEAKEVMGGKKAVVVASSGSGGSKLTEILEDETLSKSEKARRIFQAGETNISTIAKLIPAAYSQVSSAVKKLQ